ncbi:acyl-CoA dehydrogenase family protein [Cupriavidus numazuensis]|uniref:Acyl-CoA dehydrogenase fadE12 n=1 Tax=Cupriavidus numazuensis TaxID=221992 RepID=A0ABM8TVA7_9BURK|nr:acyl-CoA dehydrogenase family protein [Cupriavidus numazuensis]CAG2160612.1 Acyl-CoA dehydrogenase fadE12 [Cupriavidus numazuensis]
MGLDTEYTETQRAIARFVESLASRYGRKYIRDLVSSGATFPHAMWNDIAQAGYLGMAIPEEFGGTAMSYDDVRVFFTEMGRHGLITLHFVSYFMDCLLVGAGNQAMKERYLPKLAAGEYWSFAITEPSAGTNSFRISTSAVREGSNYRINGQKVFITGFAESQKLVLVTKTDVKGTGPRKEAFTLFVIDRNAPGITCTPMNMGTHSPESQYIVFFEDVVVPEENRIGAEGAGLEILFNALNLERIVIAALALGLGEHVFAKGVAYAKDRVVFGEAIGSHQAVQHMLARAFVKLRLANLANREAAIAFDRGNDSRTVGMYANMAKLACTEAAFEAGDAAFQVHGGAGITDECDVAAILPMIRTLRVAPINNEMTLNYLGEKCLGLPKSY